MGLILTTLIITAPPMAAMFFNGTMGHFGAYAMMGAQLGAGGGNPERPVYGHGAGYQPPQPGLENGRERAGNDRAGEFSRVTTPSYANASMWQGSPEGQAVPQGSGWRTAIGSHQQQYVPITPGSQGAAHLTSPPSFAQQGGGTPPSSGSQGAAQSSSPVAQPQGSTNKPQPPPKDPGIGRG